MKKVIDREKIKKALHARGWTQKDLARELDVTAQAQFDRGLTTRVIATLIKHKFVKKERDIQDGRGEIASLTVQGQELVSEVTPLAAQRNEELLSCLTKNERVIFNSILNKLTDQAKVMLQTEKVAQLGVHTKYGDD